MLNERFYSLKGCASNILYRDGRVLERIDFEPASTQAISHRGTSHEVSASTVRPETTILNASTHLTANGQCMVWWCSQSKGIIRIFNPQLVLLPGQGYLPTSSRLSS